MASRPNWDWLHKPISCYEVHLGSWRRHGDGSYYGYREMAGVLANYARDLHFTHVE